ncbi:hypothetical protein D3C85_680570 [compost metagenome]
MAIIDLYSKRQKRLRGEVLDVYTYDQLPKQLQVQITQIISDALGSGEDYHRFDSPSEIYKLIVNSLCREYGTPHLVPISIISTRNFRTELIEFFLQEKDIERQLDVVELSFRLIDGVTREFSYLERRDGDRIATDSITELNVRFNEHRVGYQFEGGEIIRIDSEFIHSEAVKPALRLLSDAIYSGAQDEFLSAHEHYRHGNNKEALVDCLKSFESTMKAICEKRKWKYSKQATAKSLIDVCFINQLIPSFWQLQMTSLKSMLESGIPTGRNNLGGHGQGSEIIEVPDYLVAYMLHMTASTLVFMINAEKNLK